MTKLRSSIVRIECCKKKPTILAKRHGIQTRKRQQRCLPEDFLVSSVVLEVVFVLNTF